MAESNMIPDKVHLVGSIGLDTVLRTLQLAPGTELYLGLIHADGAENVKQRIAAASKYVSDFGIATECGMARARTPEVVMTLLQAHAANSQEPGAAA